MYKFQFSNKALKKDFPRLKKEGKNLRSKTLDLIIDMCVDPFDGLGKPEALKGDMEGCWSRRIDQKHRLVYKVIEGEDPCINIISCYGHYDDK